MEKKHILSEEDKLTWWGEGPWIDEPDYVEFEHKGIKCIVKRVFFYEGVHVFGGHFCGYCNIPEYHPLYNKFDGDSFDNFSFLSVHGGITFAENGWIGFDCAHARDIIPSMVMNKEISDRMSEIMGVENDISHYKRYKELNFVEDEVKRLADQIVEYKED